MSASSSIAVGTMSLTWKESSAEIPSKVGLHSLHIVVDVWGEMASHKRSHYPSSQGWASRSHLLYICLGYGWVTSPFFLSVFLKLVCYICTCVSVLVNVSFCFNDPCCGPGVCCQANTWLWSWRHRMARPRGSSSETCSGQTTSAAYHFRFPLSTSGSALVHVSKRLWVRVPQVELNFLLSFLSTCYLSSTSFYLSSTPFCVPVFIQLCLAWNRERVALQLRTPPIDE